jgi:hypothetical protein
MSEDSLQAFAAVTRRTWAALSSEVVASMRTHVERLLDASPGEPWLAALHANAPESSELYRDATHEFLLLAHTEQAGLYRPPHDHGRGWVLYGIQRGEMEMATYRRVHDFGGNAYLVKREVFTLSAGDVRVFLPEDIHDTRCVVGPLTLLRFTSRDFKKEEVTRYPAPQSGARA